MTENGWTNNDVCKAWFLKQFLPHAKKHSDPDFPIVLLHDGHGSHLTVDMIDPAMVENTELVCLPEHTTHRLQPCDVGAFGPLKREWNKRVEAYLARTGETLPIKEVVREYMAARCVAFKATTIKNAFYKSGIKENEDETGPRAAPEIFTEADYAPSVSTSTQLHLPDGYPRDYGDHIAGYSDPETCIFESSDVESVGLGLGAEASSPRSSHILTLDDISTDESSGEDPDYSDPDPNHTIPEEVPVVSAHWTRLSAPVPRIGGPYTPGPNHSTEPLVAHYDDPSSDAEPEPDDPISKARYWKARALGYLDQRDAARHERDEVTTNAILAGRHIQHLQSQMNTKSDKKKGRVKLDSHVITTEEGRKLAQQQKETREAKQKKNNELHDQRVLAEAETIKLRSKSGRGGLKFNSPLEKLKLQCLRNLAWSCMLSEDGTRDVLIIRINAYFAKPENAHLRVHENYRNLFPQPGRKRGRNLASDQPVASSSRCTLDDPTAPDGPSLRKRQRLHGSD